MRGDWRLFCPESWDDRAVDDPVAAAGSRRRRELSRIPDPVRHTEKWRLALEMIEEMTQAGWVGCAGAGSPRPAVPARLVMSDIGYGDNALFRQELTAAGWRYVVAVKGSPRAHPAGAIPRARPYGGLGQPPKAAYPGPPVSLRELAIARADAVRPVTWRQGAKATCGNPRPP